MTLVFSLQSLVFSLQSLVFSLSAAVSGSHIQAKISAIQQLLTFANMVTCKDIETTEAQFVSCFIDEFHTVLQLHSEMFAKHLNHLQQTVSWLASLLEDSADPMGVAPVDIDP